MIGPIESKATSLTWGLLVDFYELIYAWAILGGIWILIQ